MTASSLRTVATGAAAILWVAGCDALAPEDRPRADAPIRPATLAVPAPPTNFAASYAAATGVQLSWVGEAGARFHIRRRAWDPGTGSFGLWSLVARTEPDATAATDGTVAAGVRYEYQLRACTSEGCSSQVRRSLWADVVPASPGVPSASVVSGSLTNIAWTSGGADQTTFRIDRRTHRAGAWSGWQPAGTVAGTELGFGDTFTAETAGDRYRYRIRACNGAGCSTPTVGEVFTNPAPLAAHDGYDIDEDVVLNVGVAGVLANDATPGGAEMTVSLLSAPAQGDLTLNDDGSFAYTPNENFHGNDSFTYLTSNGTFNSAPATVDIAVLSINDAPVVYDAAVPEEGFYTTVFGGGAEIGEVVVDDADVGPNPLRVTIRYTDGAGFLTVRGLDDVDYYNDETNNQIPNSNFISSSSLRFITNEAFAHLILSSLEVTPQVWSAGNTAVVRITVDDQGADGGCRTPGSTPGETEGYVESCSQTAWFEVTVAEG